MVDNVDNRIAELEQMTEDQLKVEHLRVFGWEPLFERRREMLEKLIAEIRDPSPERQTNTDEKE